MLPTLVFFLDLHLPPGRLRAVMQLTVQRTLCIHALLLAGVTGYLMVHWRAPQSAAPASQVRSPTQAELLEIVRLNRAFSVKGYYDSQASQKRCLALIDLLLRSMPPEHPEIVSNRRLLAESFESSHDYVAAAEQYRELLKVYQRVMGADDAETQIYQKKLDETLRYLSMAEDEIQRSRTWHEAESKALGPGHPQVLLIQSVVSSKLMSISKYHEAESELRLLIGALRQKPEDDKNLLAESLIDLASCLNAQGRRIEAAEIAHEVEWIVADTPRMDHRYADSVTSVLKAINAGRIRRRVKS